MTSILKKRMRFLVSLAELCLFFLISANVFAGDNLEINVSSSKGIAIAGCRVYGFTQSGAYTGINQTTDTNGTALFDSASFNPGDYKFRVDYLGCQFWSDIISLPDTLTASVIISEETTAVAATTAAGPAQSVKVYLFSGAGAYLGKNKNTDSNGQASFDLPLGRDFKFRADILGSQYWSAITTIQPGINNVSIDAGGGILQVTVEKSAGIPMQGLKTYLFKASGSYLGMSQTTDESGIVQYNVPEGNYKVRADYLGFQHWTQDATVTENQDISLTIPHQDVTITVQGTYQGAQEPVTGIKVYLFTSSGTYMGQNQTTDTNGQATFNLPEQSYKVRADYMSQQYWSNDFTWQDTDVNIPMADAEINVTGAGQPLEGVRVYVFSGTGTYLGLNNTSDVNGDVLFRLPAGEYKFRADYQSSQYWSEVETLITDQVNPVAISTGGGIFNFEVTKGVSPLAGVNCYLFTESGTYLGLNATTDGSGHVSFSVADGSYKVRVDYLGYQFWSNVYTVPGALSGNLDIPHQDVTITVQGAYQGAQEPVEGIRVYLFTSSGAYMGQNQTTDINGQVAFNLPEQSYKVRADYMAQQFWSGDFTWQDTIITIPKGMSAVHVMHGSNDVQGANVYLFSQTGSYLGRYETTDSSGMVWFQIPAGNYKFRADNAGEQKWSYIVTVNTDQTTNIEINFSDLPIIIASADPDTILQGDSSELTWQTINAETVAIDPDIGVVELSGTVTVSPEITTDFIITATGPGGTAAETVTVNVMNIPMDIDYGIDMDEQQGGGGLVGETIRILNGNVIESRSDLQFPSPNTLGLSLDAFYNSRSNSAGSMGHGWTNTYEMYLDPSFDIGETIYLKITDSTGRAHYFTEETAGEYSGVFGEKTHVKLEEVEYIWYLPDGAMYLFSSAGQLTGMEDIAGNIIDILYDANDRIETVSDLASGRSLTFSYNANSLLDHIIGPASAAVPDGIWVSYDYDSEQNLISVLYADESGFNYAYTDTNDIHNLTEKTNKMNHLINTWGYDENDRAISNLSRDGRGVTIVYESGTQVNVTDAYGKEREYFLIDSSGRNRVSAIIDGPGGAGGFPYTSSNAVSWIYDEDMNPVEVEYAGGTVNQYQDFDEMGNPETVILAFGEPEQRVVYYTYHPDISTPLTHAEPSVLGAGNKENIWDYDDDYDSVPNEDPTGLVSRIIEKGYTMDASGSVVTYEYITTYTYNGKGQVLSIDGPLPGTGDTTSITYDPITGDLLSFTRPIIGSTTLSGYDAAGQAGTVTDINGQSKTYTYDARGRVISVTNNVDGSVSGVLYNNAGLPFIRTDEDLVDTTFEYDTVYGRLLKRFDHQDNYIKYDYDPQGNVTEQGYYDPSDNRTNRKRYLYQDTSHNMPGLLFREISGDDTFTQYGYDLEGNVASVTNPNGNTTYYVYDALNRVITVTQPGSAITTYDYDAHGNLISVEDAESHITAYVYDDMGRLVSTTSPDTGTVAYVYDEAGNPVNKTDAKDITVNYDYDVLNRLTNVNFPDSTQNITYSYDEGLNGIGRRTGMNDESGIMTFGYDNRGRLTDKTSFINGITYNLSRSFTPAGRVSSITYPTGRTIDYHRTACACSVDSITTTFSGSTDTLMENLSYRPFGGAKAMNTGGGGTVSSQFDDAGRITISNPGAVHEETFTYDNNGNLTSITSPSLPYHNRVYGYDALDRLENAEGPWGVIDYTYDDVGNRLTETVDTVAETYSYVPGSNIIDSIASGSAVTYTHDANGNITGINNKILTYNQNNRLIMVEEDSVTLGEYTYNGLGQRIIKEAGGITTVFHYDFDGNIIGESDETGTFSKEYLYRSSSRLAMVNVTNGAIYFYGNDSLGTPQILTDSTNTVIWEATYKPFGGAEVNPNSTVVNNFRYQGQYFDSETGFHYNYHRYYEPSTGRYLTPDPIGIAGGINLFTYASLNPINNTDPLGLLDIISVHDYWTQVGNRGADRAINGGTWDSVAGNSQAVAAATLSSFIDFFALRTFQDNVEKAGYYSAQEDCEGQALKYGGLALGQAGLEVFGGELFARLGSWMGRPFWRYVGSHSNAFSKWLTRGRGWKAPFGDDFLKAKDALQLPNVPTDVIKVDVPWYKPVRGPRPAQLHPEWGSGGGPEYHIGWGWPE